MPDPEQAPEKLDSESFMRRDFIASYLKNHAAG